MSDTSTINIRGELSAHNDIPYTKYFELCSYENWSLHHYVSLIIDNYKFARKDRAHQVFFMTLENINKNSSISQDIRDIAQNLIKNRKVDVKKVNNLWKEASKEEGSSPPPVASSSVLGKRQRDPNIVDLSPKKQCTVPDISYFCPNIDVPLRANGTLNVLEVVKSTVRTFEPKTITLGSSRSYKSSNHLLVDSKQNMKVPRESTYDAEMYRILANWLAKVHGYEITGQWHLEGICDDGDYHHFYCDLTIKKADAPTPVAVIEILASGSVPKIKKHFDQVLKYANQLCPEEVWIVHFSREDSIVMNPYWPNQEKGLNVIHFWHDIDFKSVRMSAKFRDATGKYCEIIDEPIIP